MKKMNFPVGIMALIMGAFTLAACSDDDDDKPTTPTPEQQLTGAKFIIMSSDPENDLSAGVRFKVYNDLNDASRTGQAIFWDEALSKVADTFTQITWNPATSVYTGYVYARAAAPEEQGGIGSMKAGIRQYNITNDGKLSEIGRPVLVSNFGNTGHFGQYAYAAEISGMNVVFVDKAGNQKTNLVPLDNHAIDDEVPTMQNILDLGNGRLGIVLYYPSSKKAYVALTDENMQTLNIISDARIGGSYGANRSVRYSQSAVTDDGDAYVFCGSEGDETQIGALRIKKGESQFDASYHFDILAKSDGYYFRKAFYVSDNYFLLEYYLSPGYPSGNTAPSGRFAIADMKNQTITWVDGLPDGASVSFGWGDGMNGKYFLPVAAGTQMSGGSGSTAVTPTIYTIDAATGKATPFMTFNSNELLKSISILK